MFSQSRHQIYLIVKNLPIKSYPNENNQNRDSDTEDVEEKKYGEGGATPPSFDCDAEEVIGVGSMVFDLNTLNSLVDYFTQLTSVIQDPGSVAQITAKELPNRIRFSFGIFIF